MKKIQTLLMMFSLFFLFSFSSAATFTFEEGKYQTYGNAYLSYEDYLSDFNNLGLLSANQISPSLPSFEVSEDVIRNFPYQTFVLYPSGRLTYYFTSAPMFATLNKVDYSYSINQYSGLRCETASTLYHRYRFNSGSTDWEYGSYRNEDKEISNSSDMISILYANYDILNYYNNSLVYSVLPQDSSIKMENPLSDAEIKDILEIFLESVRNADLPEHYGRYFLVYNKETGQYSGYVYPSYADLDLRYYSYDADGMLNLVNGSFGEFYRVSVYQEDESFFGLLFDSVSGLFKKRHLYEFKSNSLNTYFYFNQTLSLDEDFIKFDIVNEPIVYTSHHIYSLIYSEDDWQFNIDESTSIDKQDFIINPETGEILDTTINEYTEEVNSDVNILSFIKLLFEFIFSLVSFLIKFFTFIVTFIIVPASTTILPEGFVKGIDWIHLFAFGEMLLWDIFSILFGVLLSLYIVKLIRSH